jgi:hypothetical protein
MGTGLRRCGGILDVSICPRHLLNPLIASELAGRGWWLLLLDDPDPVPRRRVILAVVGHSQALLRDTAHSTR